MMRIEYDMISSDSIWVVNKFIASNAMTAKKIRRAMIYKVLILLWAMTIALLSKLEVSAIFFAAFACGVYLEHRKAFAETKKKILADANNYIGHHIVELNNHGVTRIFMEMSGFYPWKHIYGYFINEDAILISHFPKQTILIMKNKLSADNINEMVSILTRNNIPELSHSPSSIGNDN